MTQPVFPIQIIGSPAATSSVTDVRIHRGQDLEDVNWAIPQETPVAFVYNRRNYAVMLATPDNLVEYALGFSLTEGIIDSLADIESLDIVHSDRGVDLRFTLTEAKLEKLDVRQRRRTLIGNAGCGICGLESIESLYETLPKVAATPTEIVGQIIERALEAFQATQPLNKLTRSVHGAAWVSLNGTISATREDVGRHNALDKLLGALALMDTDIKNGFILLSSRCSYELVEKAIKRGVLVMVTISAPTAYALEKAQAANLTLYARAPGGIAKIT